MHISQLNTFIIRAQRVKFGNYFFDRATNSGSAVEKISDNLTLVHCSKIKWNLAFSSPDPERR
jgi:hypothetical protein